MSPSYTIAVRLIIEGENEEQAQAALDAIERLAKRTGASVDVYVEASEETVG